MDKWFTAAYLNVGVHFNQEKGVMTLSFINPFNLKSYVVLTDITPNNLFGEDEEVLYLNICQEIALNRCLLDIGKDLVFIIYDEVFGWCDAYPNRTVEDIERCYRNELNDLINKRKNVSTGHWQLEAFNHISNGVLKNV